MAEEATLIKPEELNLDPSFKEMIEIGLFYGRKKSKTNPKMKQFIVSNRNGIEIVNLTKTKETLDRAGEFLKEKVRKGAMPIFVGTQPPAEGITGVAQEFGFPVVTRRWLGGTLTNYRVISKRVEYYRKLKSDWENKQFEKYTKKERVGIERELRKLHELMSGLAPMTIRPDVLIVIDPNVHATAVREAKQLGIPVVAFANTDSDPDLLDYAVVGNNKAKVCIEWFLSAVRSAIEEGRRMKLADDEKKKEELAQQETQETKDSK